MHTWVHGGIPFTEIRNCEGDPAIRNDEFTAFCRFLVICGLPLGEVQQVGWSLEVKIKQQMEMQGYYLLNCVPPKTC